MVRIAPPQKRQLQMKKVMVSIICTPPSKSAINKGWPTKPTARCETARLASKMLAGKCNEGVFQIAVKAARFPNIAVKQRQRFTVQIVIR